MDTLNFVETHICVYIYINIYMNKYTIFKTVFIELTSLQLQAHICNSDPHQVPIGYDFRKQYRQASHDYATIQIVYLLPMSNNNMKDVSLLYALVVYYQSIGSIYIIKSTVKHNLPRDNKHHIICVSFGRTATI